MCSTSEARRDLPGNSLSADEEASPVPGQVPWGERYIKNTADA